MDIFQLFKAMAFETNSNTLSVLDAYQYIDDGFAALCDGDPKSADQKFLLAIACGVLNNHKGYHQACFVVDIDCAHDLDGTISRVLDFGTKVFDKSGQRAWLFAALGGAGYVNYGHSQHVEENEWVEHIRKKIAGYVSAWFARSVNVNTEEGKWAAIELVMCHPGVLVDYGQEMFGFQQLLIHERFAEILEHSNFAQQQAAIREVCEAIRG